MSVSALLMKSPRTPTRPEAAPSIEEVASADFARRLTTGFAAAVTQTIQRQTAAGIAPSTLVGDRVTTYPSEDLPPAR